MYSLVRARAPDKATNESITRLLLSVSSLKAKLSLQPDGPGSVLLEVIWTLSLITLLPSSK